jgi:predicted naringenin-chalcone synthase
MVRIFKILDIPREKLTPSLDSYNRYSNMSSAGIFFILRDILQTASSGTGVNLLSMGAGFDVVYGLVRKR